MVQHFLKVRDVHIYISACTIVPFSLRIYCILFVMLLQEEIYNFMKSTANSDTVQRASYENSQVFRELTDWVQVEKWTMKRTAC